MACVTSISMGFYVLFQFLRCPIGKKHTKPKEMLATLATLHTVRIRHGTFFATTVEHHLMTTSLTQ